MSSSLPNSTESDAQNRNDEALNSTQVVNNSNQRRISNMINKSIIRTLNTPHTARFRKCDHRIKVITAEGWKKMTCCKKLNCFRSCISNYLSPKVKISIKLSNEERRSFLTSLLTSEGFFSFDNRRVCSIFLSKSFQFSCDLQQSVREACSSCSSHISRKRGTELWKSLIKEGIISFIRREAEMTSHKIPDCNQIHLPYKLK